MDLGLLLRKAILVLFIFLQFDTYGQDPQANCQDITVSLNADGGYSLTAEEVNNGSTAPGGFLSLLVSPNTFDCDDVGNNTVTLIITDLMGDTSSCTATVVVVDDILPILTCVSDFTISLDMNGMGSIETSDIVTDVLDVCGVQSITLSQSQFTCVEASQIVPVTITATDVNSNTNTCITNILVQNNNLPIVVCRDTLLSLNAVGMASVTGTQLGFESYDMCGGPLTYTLSKSSFTCSDIGTNIVMLTVTNENMMSATCMLNVEVAELSVSFSPSNPSEYGLCMPSIALAVQSNGTITPGSNTFSGPGIIDASAGVFDPSVAGVGIHTIEVTSLVNTCPVSAITIIEVTPLELELLDYCACLNDSEPDALNGSYNSIVVVRGEAALPSGKLFRVFLTGGAFTQDGNLLPPNTPFIYCNGMNCPNGVAAGEYYLQVVTVNAEPMFMQVQEFCSNSIISIEDEFCSAYPSLPVMPSIFNDTTVCLTNDISVSADGGFYSLNNDPEIAPDLPPGFVQTGNTLNISSAEVTNLSITLYLHKSIPNPLNGIPNTCYSTSSRELDFLKSPSLTSDHFSCIKNGQSIYLSTLLESYSDDVGTYTVNGNVLPDGLFTPPASGCYTLFYNPNICNFPTVSVDFLVTFTPAPAFTLAGTETSPVCSDGGTITILATRSSTGLDPLLTVICSDPTLEATTSGNISMGSVAINMPAPTSTGGVNYTICLTEFGIIPMACDTFPGMGFERCEEVLCRTFTIYNDGFGCGVDAIFPNQCVLQAPSEACPIDTSPTLNFACRWFTIRGPRIITSSIRGEQAVYNCRDENIGARYSLNLPGVLGTAVASGPTIGSLPGLNVICSILNWRLRISFKVFGKRFTLLDFKPFGNLGDGCNRTIGQLLLDALSALLGGDGGGGYVAADTKGIGVFDAIEDIPFGISNQYFEVPNRIQGTGYVTFRVAGGWPFKANGLCGNIVTEQILLLDLLPIGSIPIVGSIVEDLLAAAGCNINLVFSDSSDVQIPVFDNTPPIFYNCQPGGYTYYTTTGCATPVDWALPSAFEECRGSSLNFMGITTGADTDLYTGPPLPTFSSITEAGIYQILGPVPGSILPPGIYSVTYSAVGCSGNFTNCTFEVEVSIEQPILSIPADMVFNNNVGTCTAVINGLAPTQGLGCLTTLNYSYINPVSMTLIETNSTQPGVHNIPDGNTFELGTTVINYTLTSDNNGNGIIEADEILEESFSITIRDTEYPVAQCLDVEVQLNSSGMATVYANSGGNNVYINGGCTDNCNANPLVQVSRNGSTFSSSVNFSCEDVGENFITLRVTDAAGNSSDCIARVKVLNYFQNFQMNLNFPAICLGPFQETFDLSPYVTINLPNGTSIGHDQIGTLGSAVFGDFMILGFTPDPGELFELGDVTENGIFTPGSANGYLRIGYALGIEDQLEETPFGIEGCFKLTSQVVRIEKYNPDWDAGFVCCDAGPIWLGGANNSLPPGLISLEDVGGTYPTDIGGSWTGEGVSFVDPDGINFSGDEYFQFDPAGLDGEYNITYLVGEEACTFSSSRSMRVTCQPLQISISDREVCPNTVVGEIEILTDLSDYDLLVTTTGVAAVGGVDLVDEPVVNGRVVIESFTSVTVMDQNFPITVHVRQANTNGCEDEISFIITVRDVDAPVFLNCPLNQTFTISLFPSICEGSTIWSIPVAVDNCGIETFEQTAGPSVESQLSVGIYLIEYTATDFVGNATVCSFFINVIDTEIPVIVCPGNVVINSTDLGTCEWLSPPGSLRPLLANANCPAITTWDVENPDSSINSGFDDVSGYVFQFGRSIVTYTITEIESGQVWVCSFSVDIIDEESPTLNCPDDLTIECADPNNPTIIADWIASATATDNCDDDVEIVATVFSINSQCGLTETILYRFVATDDSGNTTICFRNVIIEDTTPPLIVGGEDRIMEECDAPPGGNFPDFNFWLSDNAGATAIELCGTYSWTNDFHPDNWVEECGNTRYVDVEFTATDICGNSSSIVRRFGILDRTVPIFTNCPRLPVIVDAPLGWCSSFVNFSAPAAVDNCSNVTINQIDTTGLNSGDLFPVGLTILIFEAVDECNNRDTCMYKIIVNDFRLPPDFECPESIEVVNDENVCGAAVNDIGIRGLEDNCIDNVSVIYRVENIFGDMLGCGIVDASGFYFGMGTNIVTYEVRDQSILLITEITHSDDLNSIEITNFGPAAYDITCLEIRREGPDNTSFVVPAETVLLPGDVYVQEFPTTASGTPAGYYISFLHRIIDGVAVNGYVPVNFNWSGILEGEAYTRTRICDTDSSEDWRFNDDCFTVGLGELNIDLTESIFEWNGTLATLQSENPSLRECSFGIEIVDTEAPYCADVIVFDYEGEGGIIESNNCFVSSIVVTEDFQLSRVRILDLAGNYPTMFGLTAKLVSPAGTEIILFDNICNTTSNFDINFSDDAAETLASVLCGPAGQGGTYRPLYPLKTLAGERSAGEWRLEIFSSLDLNGDIGNWTLQMEELLPYSQTDVTLENETMVCGAEFTWIHAFFADNCCEGTIRVDYSSQDNINVPAGGFLAAGGGFEVTEFFEVGVTLVLYTLVDQYGNESTCSFEVTILDTEDPTLATFACQNVNLYLGPGECTTKYIYPSLGEEDNCSIASIVYQPDHDYDFPIGTTIVTVIVTDPSGNFVECDFNVNVIEFIPAQNTLICNNEVNLSLGADCSATINGDFLLEGNNYRCYDNYCITLWDEMGRIIGTSEDSTAIVGLEHVGTTVKATICSCLDAVVNCCTTYINVEAFAIPYVTCPEDVTLQCNADISPASIGEPILLNCVPSVQINYFDTFQNFGTCGSPRAQILRKWIIMNDKGDKVECDQLITIVPFDLEMVEFPADLNYNNALNCEEIRTNPDLLLPEITGRPTINGQAVFGAHLCEFNVGYWDEVLQDANCSGAYSILRHWTIENECLPLEFNVNPLRKIQRIKVNDTEGPRFSSTFDDITISTSNFSCMGTYFIGDIGRILSDDCSNLRDITVIVSGCQVVRGQNNTFTIRNMKKGVHNVRVIASDDCWNYSETNFSITVQDQAAPIAVCIEETVVSLTTSGQARLFASSIDNGSFENCGDYKREIFRMTDNCGIPANTQPGDYVDFCCADVGIDPVQVVMRIWDDADGNGIFGSSGDNFNECMVLVTINSKIPPIIECPADITVDCEEDIYNTSKTGVPVVIQGCGDEILFYTDVANLNHCGTGVVTRRWQVEGFPQVNCTQIINVNAPKTFDAFRDIIWPNDWTGSCMDNLPMAAPILATGICESVAVSKKDEIFYFVEDVCYKILRTWTVIDWCVYEVNDPLERGKYTYVQVIKIVDEEAPVIDNCESVVVGFTGNDCNNGTILLIQSATDLSCGINASLNWTYRFDRDNDGIFNVVGTVSGNDVSIAVNNVPLGVHRIEWIVTDGCGNTSTCTQIVEVKDIKAPSPICTDEIIAVPMANGSIDIHADWFNIQSSDNCTGTDDLRYSFSETAIVPTRTFSCEDIENGVSQLIILDIWVWDLAGNKAFCTVRLVLQDKSDACPDEEDIISRVRISGTIVTENLEPLKGAEVSVTSHLPEYPKTMVTQQNGQFVFDESPTPGFYLIKSERDYDYLNGVSTLDLVLIQRYILGMHTFNSPYKLIAADVTSDQKVNALDITELRSLILHKLQKFNDNQSWRFVDADFIFDNPKQPWPFNEQIDILADGKENFSDNKFIAVKIGDVNGSALGRGVEGRSNQNVQLVVADKEVKKDEIVEFEVYGRGIRELSGYQFTLHAPGLDLLEIYPGELNFDLTNVAKLNNGVVTASYGNLHRATLTQNEVLFTMKFRALADGLLNEMMTMSSLYTIAEAYVGENLDVAGISLEFRNIIGSELIEYALYQNEPNPFNFETKIAFDLAFDDEAIIKIQNVAGRELIRKVIQGQAGRNEFYLLKSELGGAGVFYYTLESGSFSVTRKMILID